MYKTGNMYVSQNLEVIGRPPHAEECKNARIYIMIGYVCSLQVIKLLTLFINQLERDATTHEHDGTNLV